MVSISSDLRSKSLSLVSTGFRTWSGLVGMMPCSQGAGIPARSVSLVSSSHLDVPLLFPWCRWFQPQPQPLYISLWTSALLLLFFFFLATSYL